MKKIEEMACGRSRATAPFLIPLVIVLFMITFIPELTTFLPRLLLGIE